MKLKYFLRKNPLKSTTGFFAQVKNLRYYNVNEIIKQITKPGSILKYTECAAVLAAFFKQLATNLKDGIGFRNEYIEIKPNIQGVFTDADDKFDPKRHNIVINVVCGDALLKSLAQLEVEKVAPGGTNQPVINFFFDIGTRSSEALTPGNVVNLEGAYLKFNEQQADEGVFIIHRQNKDEHKSPYVFRNKPSNLSFEVPENLPKGQYYIEVRTRPHKVKSLRTARLDTVLTV